MTNFFLGVEGLRFYVLLSKGSTISVYIFTKVVFNENAHQQAKIISLDQQAKNPP